jgi:hypothetical protein
VTETPRRSLTPALRSELGLPDVATPPYKWAFASMVVGIAAVPLGLAHMWSACIGGALIGLVILPAVRWFEQREAHRREDVYRYGTEVTGRVLDVEPAGPGRTDHVVRVEFRAGDTIVRTSAVGSPLARRGLAPDDDVLVVYAPEQPARCLVVRKVAREIVDAVFDD